MNTLDLCGISWLSVQYYLITSVQSAQELPHCVQCNCNHYISSVMTIPVLIYSCAYLLEFIHNNLYWCNTVNMHIIIKPLFMWRTLQYFEIFLTTLYHLIIFMELRKSWMLNWIKARVNRHYQSANVDRNFWNTLGKKENWYILYSGL